MAIAQQAAALRRRFMVRAAAREARRGQVDTALLRLEKAAGAKDLATRRAALLAAADLTEAHGRLAETAEHLRNLVRLDDNAVDSWSRLVARLEANGEAAEAVYGLRRIIALAGEDIPLRVRIAGLVETHGDTAARIEAWEDVLRLAPDHPLAHRHLADLLQWTEPERALPHIRALATLDPLAGQRQLALALQRLGDEAGAIEAWRAVLGREPGAADAHQRLADLLEPAQPDLALPHLVWLAENRSSVGASRRLALLQDRRGDKAGAIAAWKRLLEQSADAIDARRRLADLLEAAEPEEAVGHLRRVAEIKPTPAILHRLAQIHGRLGQPDEAASAWFAALELKAGDVDAHLGLAELFEAEAPDRALPHLQAAARVHKRDLALWKRLAQTATRVGDDTGAAEAWRRCADLAPGDLEAARGAAGALLKVERPAEAIEVLWRYTRMHPTEQKMRRSLLGLARRSKDETTEAAVLQELSTLNNGDLEFEAPLAALLQDSGRVWDALPHLEAVVAARPDSESDLERLARALEACDLRARAVEAWRAIAALRPDDPVPQERLAALLDDLGRRREAAPHLLRFAELRPGDRKAWLRYATRAREIGDTAGELAATERLVDFKPNDPGARRRMFELLFLRRRRPEALPHLEALTALAPDDAEAWSALADLRLAAEDAEGAIAALQGQVAADPKAEHAHERLARLLDAKGDRAGAAAHMRALAEAAPDSVKAWRRLADRLRDLGDEAGQVVPLQRLSALEPDHLGHKERLAMALIAAGRDEEAAPLRWEVARAFPKNYERFRVTGAWLQSIGRRDEAVEAWRHVVAGQPDDGETHAALAELLLDMQQPEEALPHLRAAARIHGGAGAWREAARVAEKIGAIDRALDAWRRVLGEAPDDLQARDRLASLYMEPGETSQPAEAATQLEALAAAKPDNTALLRRLADAQEAAEQWSGLVETMRRLLQAKPGDAVQQRRMALALLKSGAADEALPLLREAHAAAPKNVDVLISLAVAEAQAGDPAAAAAAGEALLKLHPDDLEAHRYLAGSFYGHSLRKAALPHLRAVVRLVPDDLRNWRRIASIVSDDGDVDAQVAAWRDVLAVNPDDAGAHEQIVELLEMTDLEAALPHMEAVARLTPDKVKPWKRLGKWLQDLDRRDEAIAAWSQSLAIAPDDVETHRRLAQLHLLAGDYRAGMRHLDAFGRLNEEVAPSMSALVPEPAALAATPLVSAVILSLEGAELLESLFSSFHATNSYPAVELIVVDHGSTDDTARVLDAWQDRLPIRRIMRDANYSYSASCNLGVAEAKGELVLLLNNDVVFHEDVLGEMVRHLTPDVGIVGLKQYNSAPLPEEVLRPYHIGVRFVWDAAEGWFKPKHAVPTATDALLAHRPAYFPGVTASVMLCRKADYLAVGGLDEAYVYGHEDMDFCCKMRMDHGRRIVSLNSRAAFHRKNSTRRAEDLAALQAQRAANEALFRARWEKRIAEECLALRFMDDGSWRGWPPTVGLGLPRDAGQGVAERLMALSEDLTAHKGWRIRYLLEGEPGASDVRGLDAVIAPADFLAAGLRRQGRWPLCAALDQTAGEGFDLSLGGKPDADTVQRRLSEAVSKD
jgi:tetratricopeptide (TPR) repeat protein